MATWKQSITHDVSTVLIMKPLTKVIVAVDNKGGGNVGGEGTIMEWAPLQIPTVIHVPEECGTLKNAIQRICYAGNFFLFLVRF